MKKILGIASLALMLSATVAEAQNHKRHYHGHNHYNYNQNYNRNYYRNNNNWVAPAIGLGILGGAIAGGMLYNNYYNAAPVPVAPPVQCWNQSFYDDFGRLYIQRLCQ